jgi:hypothetical protein
MNTQVQLWMPVILALFGVWIPVVITAWISTRRLSAQIRRVCSKVQVGPPDSGWKSNAA